jgi:hypothetical protein
MKTRLWILAVLTCLAVSEVSAQAKQQKYRCTRTTKKSGTNTTYVTARSESEAIAKAKKNLKPKAADDIYVCILTK